MLDHAAAALLGGERREPERIVADHLIAVEQHEQLAADFAVALDDGEQHCALVAVREREQVVGERQSSRSRKTSISPPHGRPTPSA